MLALWASWWTLTCPEMFKVCEEDLPWLVSWEKFEWPFDVRLQRKSKFVDVRPRMYWALCSDGIWRKQTADWAKD